MGESIWYGNGKGFKLCDTLKGRKCKGVGEKITIAAQIGEINPFGDDTIAQILQALDKSEVINFKGWNEEEGL